MDLDLGVPFVLFVMQLVSTESLEFSPNELVFGHRVRSPLAVMHETWNEGDEGSAVPLMRYVTRTRERLVKAGKGLEVARKNLAST